jgi:hypothetical protein
LLKGVRAARGADIVSESSASCSGLSGLRVSFGDRSIDFFELYWLDLAQHLTKAPPVMRLLVGIPSVVWFVRPAVWHRLFTARGWLLPLLVNSVILVLWAVTVIASLGGLAVLAAPLPPHYAGPVKGLATYSPVLLTVAAVLTYLGLNADDIIDVSYIVKRYLQGLPDTDGFSLSQKARTLIDGALQRIEASGAYEDVTLVGHSFGGVLAVGALAAERRDAVPQLHFVTVGSFFDFIVTELPTVRNRLKKCADAVVERWDDFWSHEDNFASTRPTIRPQDHPNYARHEVKFADTGTPYLGGAHSYYFSDPAIIDTILAPTAARCGDSETTRQPTVSLK